MLEHVQCLHRMQIPPQCVANLFQGRNWQICIQWVSALFSFLNDVGDLDIFGSIGRVITPAKCGGKTVRGIELLTSNNDLPLTNLKLPQNQHRPGFFLGWFRHFWPIGRVIPGAKCGDKTVRGIELLYMFYINRIVLVNLLKETIQEFEANCTNHFKIACAHPIRTGHGDRSCTLHAVYECLPKRLDDHACFCFKWPLTYFGSYSNWNSPQVDNPNFQTGYSRFSVANHQNTSANT
jgi:hypothetical protein